MLIDDLARLTRDRVDEEQSGIPTYYDRRVLRQAEEYDPAWRARLRRHIAAREAGRFVTRSSRKAVDLAGLERERRSEIPDDVLIMSQGTAHPVRWRGNALFKSVFDFALIPMLLGELRPATILEVGSGTGSSALWMADLAALHGFTCEILSVDIRPAQVSAPNVRFFTGDARSLGELLPAEAMVARPRLVLEDAHVAVSEVLEYAHEKLEEGDYVVIEDSLGKGAVIDQFLTAYVGYYAVDTNYTDFFGRNATSCIDSFLRRMK